MTTKDEEVMVNSSNTTTTTTNIPKKWLIDIQKAKRTFNFKDLLKALRNGSEDHGRFERVCAVIADLAV